MTKPSAPRSGAPQSLATEVLVVGAGLAGLAAAIGFADAGVETILCGAPERLANGRTVALLDGSMRFLRAFGAGPEIEAGGAPLRALRMIDDTGALFRAPTIEFHAAEINLSAFGWNIENARLIDTLAAMASRRPRLATIPGRIVGYDWRAQQALAWTEDGRVIAAKLIVAADGRDSKARLSADIPIRLDRSAQTALTTILAHTRPHGDFSTEFHTRQGPFTLVPLPDVDAAARSSLVWVMSERDARRRMTLGDAALAVEIEAQAQSIHGAMRIAGGRGAFPLIGLSAARLTAPRLALVGDAGHVLPPIGAQGLNLGLRDAAEIIEIVASAKRKGEDIGGATTLERYEGARRGDIALRAGAVNALNRSLVADFAPLDLVRSAGLSALSAIGPLRRLAMRQGIAPHRTSPATMRR